MLVRGEDLDRFARVLCRLLGNGIRELFLNAAASSGVADFGFFERGFWIDQSIAFQRFPAPLRGDRGEVEVRQPSTPQPCGSTTARHRAAGRQGAGAI